MVGSIPIMTFLPDRIFYTPLNGSKTIRERNGMRLPWKTDDPIEKEKQVLAIEWANEENEIRRQELIERYMELDNHQIEAEKVRRNGRVSPDAIFNGLITVGIAVLTLNFEKVDILRSRVANLWLRRRE